MDDPSHVTGPDEPMDDQLDDLFALARSGGTPEELSCEREIVGAMAAIIAQPQAMPSLDQRRRTGASKAGARAGIVVAALLLGTSSAAATGNLPDAAQSAVARATSHVGIDLADPNEDTRSTTTPMAAPSSVAPTSTEPNVSSVPETIPQPLAVVPPQPPAVLSTESTSPPDDAPDDSLEVAVSASTDPSTTHAVSLAPDDPAMKGLCQAWASHGEGGPAEQRSKAMGQLELAATAAGQTVEQFCASIIGNSDTFDATTGETNTHQDAEPDQSDGVGPGTHDNAPEQPGRNVGNGRKGSDDSQHDNNEKDDKPKDDD